MGADGDEKSPKKAKSALTGPSQLRTFNEILRVNGVSQIKTIGEAVAQEGSLAELMNNEDGYFNYWTYESGGQKYKIYQWTLGGTYVGGVCLGDEKEMLVEISDGSFSAS